MIAVLVPVLARPGNAAPLAESLAKATIVPHRLVYVCSPADRAQLAACRETGADVLVADWPAGHGDYARKIQLGYDRTSEPYVFQAADDLEFTHGWDTEILRVAEETGAGVTGSNDAANPLVKRGGHSTHSLIRRSYVAEQGGTIDGPGLVLSRAYSHQWVDNELVELAKARGQWAFAEHAVVRHKHPIFDRSVPRDATYERGDAGRAADARLFQRRRRRWQGPRAAV